MRSEPQRDHLRKFIARQVGRAERFELRALVGSEPIEAWEIRTDAEVAAKLEEIEEVIEREAEAEPTRKTMFFAALSIEGRPLGRTTILLSGSSSELSASTSTRDGVVMELRAALSQSQATIQRQNDLILTNTGNLLGEATKAVAAAGRVISDLRADVMNADLEMRKRDAQDADRIEREIEAKKSLERTRVGGKLLQMAIPVIIAKALPGKVAESPELGTDAADNALANITDEQMEHLEKNGFLALTAEQIFAFGGLYVELKRQVDAGKQIASPPAAKLWKFFASFSAEALGEMQSGVVRMEMQQFSEFVGMRCEALERIAASEKEAAE